MTDYADLKNKELERQKAVGENRDLARVIGTAEAEQYLTGAPRAAQKEILDTSEAKTTGKAESYAEKAGLSVEQKETMLKNIKLDRLILQDSMSDKALEKGLKSLGYSQKQSLRLLAESKEREAQAKAARVKLYTTLASLVVMAAPGMGAGLKMLLTAAMTGMAQRNQPGMEGATHEGSEKNYQGID